LRLRPIFNIKFTLSNSLEWIQHHSGK